MLCGDFGMYPRGFPRQRFGSGRGKKSTPSGTVSSAPNEKSLNTVEVSSVGKLQYHFDVWKKFTNDPWILQTILGYSIEFDCEPFQTKDPKQICFSREQKNCADFEIQDL